MSNLLSIDPGLRACGCAYWVDGKLNRAAYVSGDGATPDLAADVRRLTDNIYGWVIWIDTLSQIVIEMPQTYGGSAAQGDANDLIAYTLVIGSLIGSFRNTSVALVRPHEWKGNVPKKSRVGSNPIRERCIKKLSGEEVAKICLPSAKSLHHNVWDAVGLGLKYLGDRETKPLSRCG